MTVFLTIVFALIALIHLAWGLRIWVPGGDETQLARTVVGSRGITHMPSPVSCFVVVVGFGVLIAALWVSQISILLWVASAIFAGRGVVAYTQFWRKLTPEEPFATYDRRYYAPLCLAIAAGLFVVLIGG